MIEVEAQLVEAACQGNQQALEKLITLTQPTLKRFARRTCASSEDAEDAVQVALWTLHQKIGTLRVIPALASWMFRIIERECIRFFHVFKKFDPLTEQSEEIVYETQISHDLRHDLVVAITSLPQIYREILVLRDIDELSALETAGHLNISVAAVKSRLHRARMMVRDQLVAGSYLSSDIEN
jgi:RNA polymerase sigma factor (sigma-70 family)